MPRDEDEAWREIVEHYDDSPTFDEPSDHATGQEDPAGGAEDAPPAASVEPPDPVSLPRPEPAYRPDPWEDEGRFVPPVPPPVPRAATPRRQAAWLGVFLAPAILLASVVLAWPMPGLVTVGLVFWFVGGFVYLVSQMPPGPRDPGDDGARL